MKKCSKCGETKSRESFYKKKDCKDGLRGSCKKCMNRQGNERRKIRRKEDSEYRVKDIAFSKDWKANNKDKYLSYRRVYEKSRYRTDPLYKLKQNIKKSIGKSFSSKSFKKNSTTQKILGCPYKDFMKHLQSQFTKGMTMENYGEWQIDHRLPLAAGQTKEEIIMLNHYTNLQPLWAADNLKKLDKHCPDELKAFFEKRRRESGR